MRLLVEIERQGSLSAAAAAIENRAAKRKPTSPSARGGSRAAATQTSRQNYASLVAAAQFRPDAAGKVDASWRIAVDAMTSMD